ADEEGGQRCRGPGDAVCGVAGQVEQQGGVDVQVDAQLVLDCGDPFIQHVSMLPDACPGGGDVVPGVAVERRHRVEEAGEVERGGQPAQRQPGQAAVPVGEGGQGTAQRTGPVGGHERLVVALGVGEHDTVGGARVECGDQPFDGVRAEEGQV